MYPTDKSCKYARRGAISAVYILIIPGKINYGRKKNLKKKLGLNELFRWSVIVI